MLPKLKGPSVVARVQKAVDTNTAMIRTIVADGKERLDNGKKQQAKTDANTTAKPGSSAEATSSTDPSQEALFDSGTDTKKN